jgi:hypothetical protein
MDLQDLKNKVIKDDLKITEEYGKIFTFIDFSNVNKWFQNDNQDWDNRQLVSGKKLSIDLEKLKLFVDIFSERTRIYYGENPKSEKSLGFTYVMRKIFGKSS